MAKVGVLGFAHGHIFAFGGEWLNKPELGVTIVSGWDRDEARGRDGCDKLGAAFAPHMEDILNDPDIDSVVITSETSFHADYVEAAAAAGKKIICYKPISLTLAQADRIVAAVEKYGAGFTMGWQMRVDPQNMKIKELLDSGEFGRVYSVRRRHGLTIQKSPGFDRLWHVDPQYNRDIFADDAAHAMDFIYWLLGMPQTVTAELSSLDNPKMPNDNGIAVYKYADGALAEVSCNFVCLAAENAVEVYCEKGTILLSYGDVPSVSLPHREEGLKWFKDGDADWTFSDIPSPKAQWRRIADQAEPLAGFLNGARGPVATAHEARDVLRMALACYVSDRTGQRVALDDERLYGV